MPNMSEKATAEKQLRMECFEPISLHLQFPFIEYAFYAFLFVAELSHVDTNQYLFQNFKMSNENKMLDEIFYSNVSFDQSKRIRNSVLCYAFVGWITLTMNTVQKKFDTIFQMQIASTNFSSHCSFSCWRAKFYARLLQATMRTLQLLVVFLV